jgi:Holliday junction resolvase RusA-like endonuclease
MERQDVVSPSIIKFTVPGEPKGKGRHRDTRSGHKYTPDGTVSYENLVRLSYLQDHPQHGSYEGPVSMELIFYLAIPRSKSKKIQALMRSGQMRPLKKPDLSNATKAVEDGLNGVAYKDDVQIVSEILNKFYDDNPRLVVILHYEEESA